MNWYFTTLDNDNIQLMARAEAGGMIGDAIEEVSSGESFFGVPYDAMHKVRSGRIEVDQQGHGKLVANA